MSDGLRRKLRLSRYTDLEDQDGNDDEEDHDEEDDSDGHANDLAAVEFPGAGEVTDVQSKVSLHPARAILRNTLVPSPLALWNSEAFYLTRTPGRSAPIFSSVSLCSMNRSNLSPDT